MNIILSCVTNVTEYKDGDTYFCIMIEFITKYKLTVLGVAVGAIGGYFYYHFVGCASGTCPITSRPLNSSLYGAMMGALLFNTFKLDKK